MSEAFLHFFDDVAVRYGFKFLTQGWIVGIFEVSYKLVLNIYGINRVIINSMKLVIPLHSLQWSIHTKDESKRGTAFAFIFGVN